MTLKRPGHGSPALRLLFLRDLRVARTFYGRLRDNNIAEWEIQV